MTGLAHFIFSNIFQIRDITTFKSLSYIRQIIKANKMQGVKLVENNMCIISF